MGRLSDEEVVTTCKLLFLYYIQVNGEVALLHTAKKLGIVIACIKKGGIITYS